LEIEEDCLKHKSETALHLAKENLAYHKRLEKQKKFLKSKGKEMLCRGLKTLDKLKEVEEKERQTDSKHVAAKAAATAYALALLKPDPFAKVKIPLLLPKV
jgi:hypothetical protein